MAVRLVLYINRTFYSRFIEDEHTQRRLQVIAQRTRTNNVVVASKGATVQTTKKDFPQNHPAMLYRWECEVCGMVHTGPLPVSCDSCGKVGSLVNQPDLHQEMMNDM
jgi:rubrerythrin